MILMKTRKTDLLILVLALILLGLSIYSRLTNTHLIAVVEGHSMEPTLNTGDIVFITPVSDPRDIQVNDVIIFKRPSGELIIHRVISIEVANGEYYYMTKGDNNPVPDTPNRVGEPGIGFRYVVGKVLSIGNGVVIKIPYLGIIPLMLLT